MLLPLEHFCIDLPLFYLYPHLYSRFNFTNYPNFFFAGYINLHFDSFWKFSLWNSFSVTNNWRYLYGLILSSSFRSWGLLIALITDDVIFLSALVIFSVNSLEQSSVGSLYKLFVLSSWIYNIDLCFVSATSFDFFVWEGDFIFLRSIFCIIL